MSYRITPTIYWGTTGATLRGQLLDESGADVGGVISTGFTEEGNGWYIFDYSSVPDGHRGALKVYDVADPTELVICSVTPEVVERMDDDVTSRGSQADLTTVLADTDELQTNQGNWLTAVGFSTHAAADVWAVGTRTLTSFGTLVADTATAVWAATTRTLSAFGFTVTTDSASREASKATGFSTHDAADVVTALGTGSTLTDCLTAIGFSTHDTAAVVTALGTGSTLTDCLTAVGFSTHDAAAVKTAIEANGTKLDHLWETTEDDAGVRRFTENALEQAPTGGTGLDAQETRDAMKLAPTAGDPAAGSVDKHLDDIQAKTDQLGTGSVMVSSPVASDAAVSFYQYDDYDDDESRAFEWTNSDGNWGSNDITGAAVAFRAKHKTTGDTIEVAGTVVTPTGTQKVRVELTSTESGQFVAGQLYDYQVRLTLSNGRKETIVSSSAVIVASVWES